MTTAYTSLLGFALPVTGELDGTWGDTVNNSITQLAEDAIAGVATQSVAAGDWTLTTTGSGASNEARKAILIPTGSPGVSRNILAPNKSKAYIVINQSNAAVVLKGSTGPTTGVTISAGATVVCAWNGSDFVNLSGVGDVTLTGTQTLTNKTISADNNTLSGIAASSFVLSDVSGNIDGAAAQKVIPSGAVVGTTDTQTLTNKTISAGVFNDGYTEETVTANTSTAYTIDLTNGTVQILTLTGNCTFTFPAVTAGRGFTLILKQDATGSRTVTWPATVKWPSSTAPTITSTASKADKYVFVADGTNWIASNAGQNYTL